MLLTRAALAMGCAFELCCAAALTGPAPAAAVDVKHGLRKIT